MSGLYKKYDVGSWDQAPNALALNVQRRDDAAGKHERCEYFVLDLNHDPFAPAVLRSYAAACGKKFPQLAQDLMKLANAVTVHQKKNP